MNSSKLFFAGYNGFNQFENCGEFMMSNITEWTKKGLTDLPIDKSSIKFCSSWAVNVIAVSNNLYLSGCLSGLFAQSKSITFGNNIKAIACNDNFCLIALDIGSCYKYAFKSCDLRELNFLNVDTPNKKPTIFDSADTLDDQQSSTEIIEHIACSQTLTVAVTNTNAVYNIPSRIYTFPKHVKVKKICCGAEHALLLTKNGDVYAWGSSSRGQLGLGKLESELIPVLIGGLAGIKITDISSGLWHSAAISAFGDLYMWGWNVNGQLGKPIYRNVQIHFENGRFDEIRHKDTTVFASPEIIDLPNLKMKEGVAGVQSSLDEQYCFENVHCGDRHTIGQTKCGKIFGCGFNKYGQLGNNRADSNNENIDGFVEISHKFSSFVDIRCGSWCTIFIT